MTARLPMRSDSRHDETEASAWATDADDAGLLAIWRAAPDAPEGRDAVSQLLGRYRRRVLAWCWQVVRDRELALDLAQDVMICAWRGLGSYQEQDRFSAWLFTIARNRCRSELRRRRPPAAGSSIFELLEDPRPGPEERLAQQLDEETLLEMVRHTLTPQEQDALWLRCFEGLSVDAITRRLEIQEASGARAVLQRARRKLRAALARDRQGTQGGLL